MGKNKIPISLYAQGISEFGTLIPVSQTKKLIPQNRRQKEIAEACKFGRIIEIWKKEKVYITIIDEAKSDYLGIDFMLCVESDKRAHEAFQLLEYHQQYSGRKDSERLAAWVKEKKYNKAESTATLVVDVCSADPFVVDLAILRKELLPSPFQKVLIIAGKNDPNTTKIHDILIGIVAVHSMVEVDLETDSLIYASSSCPFWPQNKP